MGDKSFTMGETVRMYVFRPPRIFENVPIILFRNKGRQNGN